MNYPKKHSLHFCLFNAIAILGLATSCGPSMQKQIEDYKETIRSGIKLMPWPREMEALFGKGDNFFTHYNLSPGPKTWNTEVFFGGRYEFTMQVEVEIDYKSRKVVRTVSQPIFSLREVGRTVSEHPGRIDGVDYSQSWMLDEKKWKEVVVSKGDATYLSSGHTDTKPRSGGTQSCGCRKPRA